MITDSYGGFLLKWLPLHKSSMFFLGFSIKKNHPAEIPHDYGTPRRFTRPRCQLVHGFHKTTETSGPGVWPPGLGKNMVDSTTKTSGDLQHEKWWWSNQPNCGDRMCYIYIYIYVWLVVLTILKNMKVDGKDYPIYCGKHMLETTNQI